MKPLVLLIFVSLLAMDWAPCWAQSSDTSRVKVAAAQLLTDTHDLGRNRKAADVGSLSPPAGRGCPEGTGEGQPLAPSGALSCPSSGLRPPSPRPDGEKEESLP